MQKTSNIVKKFKLLRDAYIMAECRLGFICKSRKTKKYIKKSANKEVRRKLKKELKKEESHQ